MNKKIIGGASLLAAGLIAGSFAGISGAAAASYPTSTTPVTTTTTTDPSTPTATTAPVYPTNPGAPGTPDASKPAHTPETPITGDLATTLTDLALAKYPGATVDRVENDTDGATYEVHLTLADGSHVTVLFDADKNITATETGPAFGPNGPKGPHGDRGGDHDGDHKGSRGGDDGDDDNDDDGAAGTSNNFSTITP